METATVNSNQSIAVLQALEAGTYVARGVALITFSGAPTDIDWRLHLDFRTEDHWHPINGDYALTADWDGTALPALARFAITFERAFFVLKSGLIALEAFPEGSGSPGPNDVGWGIDVYYEVTKL